MRSTPLPRWLVAGNSAIVIAISAALAGLAIGGLTMTWHPINVLVGLILLPFPLAVGGLQYAAGFRRNARAATVVGVTHLSACGFFSFACVQNAGEHFLKGGSLSWDLCTFMIIFLCMVLYCAFCGWMNLRMGKYLRMEYLRMAAADGGLSSATGGLGRFQFTLRELLGAIAVVSILASSASYIFRSEGKQYEEHITREESPTSILQLPEGATDICYCRGTRGWLVYEFTIDQAGFLKWAKNKQKDSTSNTTVFIDPIQQGQPETIERYTLLMPNRPPNEDKAAKITQGWVMSYTKGRLAYDLAKQRAYYYGKR